MVCLPFRFWGLVELKEVHTDVGFSYQALNLSTEPPGWRPQLQGLESPTYHGRESKAALRP